MEADAAVYQSEPVEGETILTCQYVLEDGEQTGPARLFYMIKKNEEVREGLRNKGYAVERIISGTLLSPKVSLALVQTNKGIVEAYLEPCEEKGREHHRQIRICKLAKQARGGP